MAETKKEIRPLPPHELESALALVWESFSDSYAAQCDQDTLDAFWDSIDYEYMLMSMGEGRIRFWGAWEDDFLVGVCAVRDLERIELLYVDAEYQGRGIGTSLLKKAAMDIKELDGLADTLRLLAPDSAVGFFEKLGFVPRGEAFDQGSLKLLPMGLKGERV